MSRGEHLARVLHRLLPRFFASRTLSSSETAGTRRRSTLSELPQDEQWSILVELAQKGEPELRRILRPHEEAGLTWELDSSVIQLRDRLDKALGKLTLFEIDLQTGGQPPYAVFSPVADVSLASMPALESLKKLFDSEAFLHFCDSYLYFGVRFLAERFSPAVPAERKLVEQSSTAESNRRPFALAPPPDVEAAPEIAADFFRLQGARPPEVEAALDFLDGFLDKPLDYELWLRGLLAEERPTQSIRFEVITRGLEQWVGQRVDFYLQMAKFDDTGVPGARDEKTPSSEYQTTQDRMEGELGPAFAREAVFGNSASSLGRSLSMQGRRRPQGGWIMADPAAARFALADLYWIARILRASVSSSGSVKYHGSSWLHLLRFRANAQRDADKANDIFQSEEVIRSVFDYCCDLIQNAIAVTRERVLIDLDPGRLAGRPPEAERWRFVFDEELETIQEQRAIRSYRDAMPKAQSAEVPPAFQPDETPHPQPARPSQGESWSERIRTGKQPRNLLGIAFSGGGIRSATFNLGVLQGLQELDLLRQMDYVSSVSGGGFIASWLVANVRRSAHWLGRVTDWNASIAHLRAYSNYLAPQSGILSADTWTLGATWVRNAFFIQITGLAWLFFLFLGALAAKPVFVRASTGPDDLHSYAIIVAFLAASLVVVTVLLQLRELANSPSKKSWSSPQVRWLTVLPAWISAFFTSSVFWHYAKDGAGQGTNLNQLNQYSEILLYAWRPWGLLLGLTFSAFLLMALVSLQRWRAHAFWITPVCTGVIYLGVAGVFYLDRILVASGSANSAWYSYVFTPALLLAAYTLGVMVFIGLTGRNSKESIREWWTRFGAWLGVYALVACALTAAAAFSPQLVNKVWSHLYPSVKWAGLAGWAGTVVSGLFAGNSSKTSGDKNKSKMLQMLAVMAGVFFIVGFVVLASTLLYFLLWKVFAPDGTPYSHFLAAIDSLPYLRVFSTFISVLGIGLVFSHFFEINIFGLNQFYRNRIVRCYLGASRLAPGARQPNRFTGFDFADDIKLHKLKDDELLDPVNGRFRGPFPIVNCALNLAGSADLSVKTRHSASFSLTPLRCGSDRPLVGYAPTSSADKQFAGGIMLGQAVAVSGAAVSPNMGYNTSPLVAFLLTMFNVRLGWWFPNPGQSRWSRSGLTQGIYYLTRELLGLADERRAFLNVSDGGHFENLAVYELVRRRCKVIVACDAECDETLHFGGLGNLIRVCQTDFGAQIDLDVQAIRAEKGDYSRAHCAVGQIKYSNGSIGYLIYLKASVTGDEPVDIGQYRSGHPSFPHETTADQFFSEDQFESYRKLGQHVVQRSFSGTVPGQSLVAVAEKLADILTPAGSANELFLRHTEALKSVWDKFRETAPLDRFLDELMGNIPPTTPVPLGAVVVSSEELSVGLQMIQLMEDVFIDLRLDDFWEHPDNRGWATLFMQWSQSARFRAIWNQTRRTFGIRFEHFCASRLGLPRDRPTIRV